jgi:hypothetical protein
MEHDTSLGQPCLQKPAIGLYSQLHKFKSQANTIFNKDTFNIVLKFYSRITENVSSFHVCSNNFISISHLTNIFCMPPNCYSLI